MVTAKHSSPLQTVEAKTTPPILFVIEWQGVMSHSAGLANSFGVGAGLVGIPAGDGGSGGLE